jgi:hypothetical protein
VYRRFQLGLACGLYLFLAEAWATLQLSPFEASFQVSRNGLLLGTMDMRFTLDERGAYTYTGHTRPGELIGLFITEQVHESSEGSYQNARIKPLRYRYLLDDGVHKKQTVLEFHWSDGQVWTESEGQRWAQTAMPDTHDKYSQQLALRLDLARGEQLVSYPVADGGKIKTYEYQVVGDAWVDLPYGRLQCLQVKRSKQGRPPDYVIWVAPALDYLPVKIQHKRTSGDYAIELLRFARGGAVKP